MNEDHREQMDAFQTDLCGIEARAGRVVATVIKEHAEFQTDLCGIEAGSLTLGQSGVYRFRRTSVGLKPPHPDRLRRRNVVFQTDLCGIEARSA